MDRERLEKLLHQVQKRELPVEDAMALLRSLPFEDLGFAKVDSHRALRNRHPEVVFCQGKTTEQVVEIIRRMVHGTENILATRARPRVYEALKAHFPRTVYHPVARVVVVNPDAEREPVGSVAVVSGGTADLPVAEEAAVVCEALGSKAERLFDVGVAGLHRLLHQKERLFEANVIIAVAGMEGALASVVAGIVDKPVIAVPTSVGYGASFGGIAALLGMLNSCSSGVSVVNIDNGFGAAYQADMINKLCLR